MSEPKKENTILEQMLTNPPVKPRNQMTKAIAVFPAIDIKTHSVSVDSKPTEYHIKLETRVRKYYKKNWYSKGKWYLQVCRQTYMHLGESKYEESALRFIQMVYMTMLFSKVQLDVVEVNANGRASLPIFELDEDQRTEEERIKSMMP